MKAIFLAVFLIYVFHNGIAQSMSAAEDRMETFVKATTVCQKDTGASADDLKELMNRELPSTKEGKCLRNCVMEKMDVIKDGKLNIDGAIAVAKIANNDPKIIEAVRKISKECASISDPDGCEYVAKLLNCYTVEAETLGYDAQKLF